jgi:Tfp pilus assembly PilM family ATPase
MFRRHREIIGIDLGSAVAKAVVLRIPGEGQQLIAREHAVVPVEAGGGTTGLERTLRQLFRTLRSRTRDCAIALWPAGAKLRFFDRGSSQTARAPAQLKPEEVQRLFPEPLVGYVSACAPVESCRESETSSMFVAEAVPKQAIDDLEAVLRKLGRRLSVLQLTPIALLNAFTSAHLDIARDEPFLVADFGKERTLIVAGYHGLARAVRVVDFPWESIITAGKQGANNGNGITSTEQGFESMQLLLKELVDVCDYLDAQDQHMRLGTMHVSGVLSSNADVMRTLGEALDLKCVHWNPLGSVSESKRAANDSRFAQDLPRLPVAAGVALQYAA